MKLQCIEKANINKCHFSQNTECDACSGSGSRIICPQESRASLHISCTDCNKSRCCFWKTWMLKFKEQHPSTEKFAPCSLFNVFLMYSRSSARESQKHLSDQCTKEMKCMDLYLLAPYLVTDKVRRTTTRWSLNSHRAHICTWSNINIFTNLSFTHTGPSSQDLSCVDCHKRCLLHPHVSIMNPQCVRRS